MQTPCSFTEVSGLMVYGDTSCKPRPRTPAVLTGDFVIQSLETNAGIVP
jgi:hypothetical protein